MLYTCCSQKVTSRFSLHSSSFACGLAGALASNPVDVVRTRMMNQRVLSGNFLYKGTLDGLMQTWRNEGFFALYKGFWPNWLRLGPWNIIVSFMADLFWFILVHTVTSSTRVETSLSNRFPRRTVVFLEISFSLKLSAVIVIVVIVWDSNPELQKYLLV